MNMQAMITIFESIAVSLKVQVGILNVFFFVHAIWVRFHPDFNNHAFRHCANFSGNKVTHPQVRSCPCAYVWVCCNIKRKKNCIFFFPWWLSFQSWLHLTILFLPIWFCFGSSRVHSGLPIASSNLGHFLDRISELILQMKEGAIMCKTQPPMWTWWKLIEDMTE